ncbi:signal recognition particle receptor subunit alpha, partial [Acinetobacter baumannii]
HSAQVSSQSASPAAAVVATKAPPVDIDEDYLENLEERLIRADLGLATAESLVQHLRKESKSKNWTSWDVEDFLKKEFASTLASEADSKLRCESGKL